MSALPFTFGTKPSAADYAEFRDCFISRGIVDSALIRRVTNEEGRQMIGQGGAEDFAGLIYPWYWPGEHQCYAHRLRRDNAPITVKRGVRKEDRKYLSAPGWSNRLYFHPDTEPSKLSGIQTAIAITEGQKKCLSLVRLAREATPDPLNPLFTPVGLNGVYGFRGITGKTTNAAGKRVSEKGVIPDLDRIVWPGRRVYIVFDTNVHSNENVAGARKELAYELCARGAQVFLVDVPEEDGINGIDDFLGRHGIAPALKLFESSTAYDPSKDETNVKELADEITSVSAFARDAGGKLYLFEGGVYKPCGDSFVHSRVKAILNTWELAHSWTSHKGKEVAEYIRLDAPELWPTPPRDVVNVLNGLLNVLNGKLQPHSPDHLSPVQLPIPLTPQPGVPSGTTSSSRHFRNVQKQSHGRSRPG